MTAPLPNMDAALCRNDPDPELWFRENISRRDAFLLCDGCPIFQPCGAYALANPTMAHGVWGGMSEKQRAEIRRGRNTTSKLPLRSTCKRNHDLNAPNATVTKSRAGKSWELCRECIRERDRARRRNDPQSVKSASTGSGGE